MKIHRKERIPARIDKQRIMMPSREVSISGTGRDGDEEGGDELVSGIGAVKVMVV